MKMISKTILVVLYLFFQYSLSYGSNIVSIQPSITNRQIQVELQLTNSDTLSGIQIPIDIGLRKLGLQIDSVSFTDTRIEHFFEYFYTEDSDSDQVFIFILESADPEIESTPLLPGSGKIATIYLTRVRLPESENHTIRIRDIKRLKNKLTFNAWNPRGENVEIEFTPLRLNVRRE